MPFISYSQNFEDVILWRALSHIENGFYIDVGANSPDEDTVTRAFYERGWQGINVEPNPRFLAELNERRPRDKNVGVAISSQTGNIRMYNFIENPGLATLDEEVANTHSASGLTTEIIGVRAQTLTEIWQEHLDSAQPVHFLKVDVEGHERDVLLSLDWSHFRPWIVLVEATYPLSQKEMHKEWESILLEARYSAAYWDGLNRYYVASEREELLAAFTAPPNVHDDFVLGKYFEPFAHLQRALKESGETIQNLMATKKHEQQEVKKHKQEINSLRNILAHHKAEKQNLRHRKENCRTKKGSRGFWNHLISVVVYGSENDHVGLSNTLNSLLVQKYRNIEIIVVGGASPRDHSLADFRTLRGLFVRSDKNANDFLLYEHHDKDWRGDYLFFASVGTVFTPHCFGLANDIINDYEEAFPDLAVFDYHLILGNGKKSDSCLLPGWDPEFALSTDNYKTAFLTSRKLIKRVRSQSASLNLSSWIRSVAKLHPQPIHAHISEPVIHLFEDSRIIETETISVINENSAILNPTVSLIIPNRNRPHLLKSCLKFLEHVQGVDLDVIIVDNNSDDIETLALYRNLREGIGAKIIDAGLSFNYSRMVNLGVAASKSEFIALINNDVEFKIPGEFESLVQQAMRPEIGIVGAHLLYPSGKIQHAGVVIDTGILQNSGKEFRCRHVLRGGQKNEDYQLFPLDANRNFLAVTGAVQVMKRQTFNHLGGYDEVYLPIEYNDIDFCLRSKKEGLRVLCVALNGVYHAESESRGKVNTPQTLRMRENAMALMLSRWGEFVESHPYGHPAIEVGDCSKPYVTLLPKSGERDEV